MSPLSTTLQAGTDDTIAAIATPPGTAGLAVLRLSGSRAVEIAAEVFDGADLLTAAANTMHHGALRAGDGSLLDEVVAAVFHAPRSYTGEHVVEISCHGGGVVSRRALARLLEAGARHAEPGEFTRRAFLNGKMDLAQAEAVADLIHAQSEDAHRASLQQLEGRLSAFVGGLRDALLHAAGMLELSLDFVEEDVEFLDDDALRSLLEETAASVKAALDTHAGGRVIRDGARIALVGAPNVGKSSILNALLGQQRAIVTEVPGTTRDYLEEQLLMHGEYVRLIDTAGLRDTDDRVEKEGIAISRRTLQDADVICLVSDARDDAAAATAFRDAILPDAGDSPVLLLFNKSDLVDDVRTHALRQQGTVVSAVDGSGIDALSRLLAETARALHAGSEQGRVLVTNLRHADCLRRGLEAVEHAQQAREEGMTEEVIAGELRRAIDALGEIIGAVTTDDILNGIFSRFCIGK